MNSAERAQAIILHAWYTWKPSPDTEIGDLMMCDVTPIVEGWGYAVGDDLTAEGKALIERARREGVL